MRLPLKIGVGRMHTLKSPTKVELTSDKVKIPYQWVEKDLPAFRHAHKTDAGYDLYSTENVWLRARETAPVQTNLRVCIPAGYVGFVTGRSGMAAQGVLCHSGTIDAGYTGSIFAIITNQNNHVKKIDRGERIAQLVILKLPEVEMVEGDLPDTERGNQGLGSTGR